MRLSLKAGTMLASCVVLTGFMMASGPASHAQQSSASCPADNSGIALPPGFCATVFADHLGHVRQMVVAPDGVLYVNTWSGRYYHNDRVPPGGMVIALKGSSDGSKADQIVRFGPSHDQGDHGGTGIWIYGEHLYVETNDKIVRYRLPQRGGIAPTGAAETIVSGLPLAGDHPMHPFTIDREGHLYVDLGSATNSCQSQNRMMNVPGEQPCTELLTRGGTWEYDANTTGQVFSAAQRFSTGLRNGEGFSFDSQGRLFGTQHGRDQLFENWPKYYNAQQGADDPAEELVQLTRGADFGWPYCYYSNELHKLVLAPEYGGDGHKIGVCAQKKEPVAAFPGHWAPNDMKIYEGNNFPTAYKDGAFIAFHGSWNRAPLPQGGYNVAFQPLRDGKASGPYVIFADGFAGKYMDPGEATHRPTGIAFAPDGSMYISDDQGGTIWHVTYQGGNKNAGIAAAAPTSAVQQAMSNGNAVPPEGVHPTAGLPIPPGGSPDQVALGNQIFHGQAANGTCAGCHGMDGKGTSAGSNLAAGKFVWSDGSVQGIVSTIEHGVPKPKDHTGNMPPDGGVQLSQADVQAVADYVWAISHEGAK